MINALSRLVTRHPWAVLAGALLLVAVAAVVGSGAADRLRAGQGTVDPDSESARADELLEEHFPDSRPNLILLVHSDTGVDDREAAAVGLRTADRLAYEDAVGGVVSYWRTGADELKSRDGEYALIAAHIEGDEETAGAIGRRLAAEYTGNRGEGVEIRAGGSTAVLDEVERTIAEDLVTSEMIALPVTLAVLVLVFSSAIAALLPLAVGVVAIIGTNAVLWAIAGFTDVSVFAQNLTTALGLGLAVDYALLMVRRYRDEIDRGAGTAEAVVRTLHTAGRTVVFSALTIAVALASLLVFPLYFLRSFAYSGVAVVLLAAAAALVLLPALLAVLGHRVDALNVRRLLPSRARRSGAARPEGFGDAFWRRLTRTVTGRAPLFAVGSVALLVLVGLPFLRVEFGMADDRQLPPGAEARQVQQVLREGFDGNTAAAIDVVADGVRTGPDRAELEDYAAALSELDNVDEVRTPVGVLADGRLTRQRTPVDAVRESGGLARLQVVPTEGVEAVSPESQRLVRDVRAVDSPFPTWATGQAATVVDTQAAIGDRLGYALALIAVSTLVLVFLLTGSLIAPLQAVLLNSLSLTAMFGAVVWIFQDGRLSGLLGFTPTGFIDTSVPVLMFCVAFGLSMDYGVFLLSRMKEEFDRTGDHRAAIDLGVRRTGGIVTAAAVILAVVMFAIGFSRITNTMVLGFGVGLAVLVDATVVRCLLVPAVMAMTGRATWWAPARLRRLHERFGLREHGGPEPEGAGTDGGGTDRDPLRGPAEPVASSAGPP
ncbi:MMPL family transporter [Streptomonospora wellingtoniae]|uniref:MMPL family transporter n=1 Tax=Streptomonospora wellingtoniae TaxID=3075544 RepID=A0ABU2KSX9_9ACTN|nr:MMPL family transporter [Streptomonospora sp. DSM 45055]MDT0302394.1 MMPL family transporter [Streptomonospora sp. DSM 45055]